MKTLPLKGQPWPEIERQLREAKQGDFDWRGGRVPYYIYFYDDALLDVQKRAYTAYIVENALSARGAFPSLGRMTDEIFEMALGIFHAPEGAGASFTSGGTESVFQAIKSARERASAERPRVTRPNLVAAYSRHPSVNKAAHILGIEVRLTPVGKDFRADVGAMRDAMDDQTILLYASSPSFPYGVFDPIRALGALALERGVWLHSDACFGGFVSPFAKKLGYPIPEFDLSVPGLTSLSADIHKFGFGCKGASVLLYADQRDEQRYGRYLVEDTASGPYATATFQGSKAGGAISAAWAVMHYLGEEGYLRLARIIMETTMRLIEGINAIDGLYVYQPYGESNLFRYDVRDSRYNIYAVAQLLSERGWLIGQHRNPPAIHHAINPVHCQTVEPYLNDLREVTAIARERGLKGEFKKRTY